MALAAVVMARPGDKPAYLHAYPIQVVSVYDGDTFTCDIDMGLNIRLTNQKVRVLGIDAFEKRDPGGLAATKLARQFLTDSNLILLTPGKRDSFGRVLGHVRNSNGLYLSAALTSAGLVTGRFADTALVRY